MVAGRGRRLGALPRHVRGDVARVGAVPDRAAAVAAAAAGRRRARRPTRATSCACGRGTRCARSRARTRATRGCGWSSSASRRTRAPTRGARRPRWRSRATSSTRSARGTCAAGCTALVEALERRAARRSAASCASARASTRCCSRGGASRGVRHGARARSRPTRSSGTATRSCSTGCSAGRRSPRRALAVGLRADARPARAHRRARAPHDPFPADYDAEFDDVFVARRLVRDPTLYVSASCATDPAEAPAGARELVRARQRARGRRAGGRGRRVRARLVERLGVGRRGSWRARAARPPTSSARRAPSAARSTAPRRTGGSGRCAGPGPVVRGVRGLYRVGGTAHPGGGLPLVRARRAHRRRPDRAGVNRTRALLLATAVPLLIVLGVLVSRDARRRRAPRASGAAASATAPAGRRRARRSSPAPSGSRSARAARRDDLPPARRDATGPVVVFLHGWLAVDPAFYAPWIAHLVRGGATVDLPGLPGGAVPRHGLAAAEHARRAAARVRAGAGRAGRLVVAGHSAGGALAADYAASARAAGLPAPAAVFSAYPGRSLRGIPLRIPAVSARNIAAGTRLLVLAGADDRVVGTRTARARSRGRRRARARRCASCATRASTTTARRSARARRRGATFWAPLDRLIAATALG